MNFEEIEQKVVQWGKDRLIFKQSSAIEQTVKLQEELTELKSALVRPIDMTGVEDGIGDMIVVLTMIAHLNNFNLTDCYLHAYVQIKDRRGKMVNGLFVKE